MTVNRFIKSMIPMSVPPGNIGILKSGIISQKIKKDWKNFFCVKYIPK